MIGRKADLLPVLKRIIQVIGQKAEHPLDLALLKAERQRLTVTATDGRIWLRSTVPCDGESPVLCLPIPALLDLIKDANRSSTVDIVAEGRKVNVVCDACATTFESKPVDDLPVAPDSGGRKKWCRNAVWGSEALRDALDWVLLAASRDETRPTLNGVLCAGDELVATDGHRLHRARLVQPHVCRTLVPAACANLLLSTLDCGPVVLERSDDLLRFVMDDAEIVTAASAAEFPPHDQVIPKQGSESWSVEVEAGPLRSALSRLARASSTRAVKLTVNGQIAIERRDDEDNVARMAVPLLSSTHEGADLEIGVNGQYLFEALGDRPTRTIRFQSGLDPLWVGGRDDNDDRVAVVMPMRT
jgi:DNA polymerase III sliding clamp (beta) subunit (PCNA family)